MSGRTLAEQAKALADRWEREADAIAITYQNADHRAIATGPWRHAIRDLRALLDALESDDEDAPLPDLDGPMWWMDATPGSPDVWHEGAPPVTDRPRLTIVMPREES